MQAASFSFLFATTMLGFSHKYTVTGFKVSDEFLIFIHSFVICGAGKGTWDVRAEVK